MLAAPVVPLTLAGASALNSAIHASSRPVVPYITSIGVGSVQTGWLREWLLTLSGAVSSASVEFDWNQRREVLWEQQEALSRIRVIPVVESSWSYKRIETIRPDLAPFDEIGLRVSLSGHPPSTITAAAPLARSLLARSPEAIHLVVDAGGLSSDELVDHLGWVVEAERYASVTLIVGPPRAEPEGISHGKPRVFIGATPLHAARIAATHWQGVIDLRVGAHTPWMSNAVWYACRDGWRTVGPLSNPTEALHGLRAAPWFAGGVFSRSDTQLEFDNELVVTPEILESLVRGHNHALLAAQIGLAEDLADSGLEPQVLALPSKPGSSGR